MIRSKSAEETTPKDKAGMISNDRFLSGSSVNGAYPPAGSTLTVGARIKISTVASQKLGTAPRMVAMTLSAAFAADPGTTLTVMNRTREVARMVGTKAARRVAINLHMNAVDPSGRPAFVSHAADAGERRLPARPSRMTAGSPSRYA